MVETTERLMFNFEKMTKKQLVKEITRRKLKKSGSKATLVDRLNDYEGIRELNDEINNTNPSTFIQEINTKLNDKDLEEIPFDEESITEIPKDCAEGNDSFFSDYIEFKQSIFQISAS